jgi:tripartite ATP-independent transporter DctP family solute receptor
MKKTFALCLALILVLSLAACAKTGAASSASAAVSSGTSAASSGASASSAEKSAAASAASSGSQITISYGHGFSPDSPQAKAVEEFKTRVEKESNGRIVVNVFPSGQLGSAQEMFESMQMGTQEMALLPTARLSGFDASLQVFDLPFLFPDKETAYKVFDGDIGRHVLDTLSSTGVKGLAIYEDGFMQFTSNKKIEKLSDFKGLKMRSMESPIKMEQFKELGCNPVPIDFNELYNALQQNTVDGQENPLATIVPSKFYEVQDYMLLSSHAYLAQLVLVSGSWFDGLDAEAQEIISRNALEIAAWERDLVAKAEVGYLKTIQDSGTTVFELSDANRQEFVDATAGVYDVAKTVIDPNLIDEVVSACGK